MAYKEGSTNQGTITQYDVLVGGASNAIASVGPGSSGQVLQSSGNAANPAYSTATYPATATGTGTILRADGTNWSATTSTYPATNAINTLLYASSANVMSALATANNAILATNSSGVPSLTTASGNWLNTARCCFSVYSSSAVSNQTGDGTAYTIVFGSSLINQGSNFDGTSTFTAPVTGRYLFTMSVLLQNLGAAHTPEIQLTTTGNNFNVGNDAAGVPAGNFVMTASFIAPMTANDTAVVKAIVASSTKTVGVYGGASDPRTTFCGYLIC